MMKKKKNRLKIISVCFALLLLISTLGLGQFSKVRGTDIDSDGDGLSDWDEINRYWSNPDISDSDGDGLLDGFEVNMGSSPLDTDSDGDFISDTTEYASWNPNAYTREEKYKRCPYIADLPKFTINTSQSDLHYHFIYTNGTHEKTNNITTNDYTSVHTVTTNTEFDISAKLDYYGRVVYEAGIKLSDEPKFPLTGFLPYFKFGVEAGGGLSGYTTLLDAKKQKITLDQDVFTKIVTDVEDYTQKHYDLSSVTFTVNVSVTNTYDRTIRLDRILFDLLYFDKDEKSIKRVHSQSVSPHFYASMVIGLGESRNFTVAFPMSEEEWISLITTKKGTFEITVNSYEVSLWSDSIGWVSQEVVEEEIASRCAMVEIVKETESESIIIQEWIAAQIDKLDGLSVLEAFDRLFLSYTYRYGRLLDIEGTASIMGKQVWCYTYCHDWADRANSESDLVFIEELRLRGRGALTLELTKDSDGDWLPDSLEVKLDTDPFDPDTDDDYADDYIEVLILKSSPFLMDTDGGGTIDGVEYFEGLNATNPYDDLFHLPNWYLNHTSLFEAQRAASILLRQGLRPAPNKLTWPAPQSHVINNTFEILGPVAYPDNDTIGPVNESIASIEIGNVDTDPDSEIVVGTSPSGLLILYDYIGLDQWNSTILCNMSISYPAPVTVTGIAIGNITNSGTINRIVFGTWYENNGDKGGLYYTDKWGSAYQPIYTDVPGVYSVDVGDVDSDGKIEVVMGSYGLDSNNSGSFIIQRYNSPGIWDWVHCVIMPLKNSSKVHVCIGTYGGDHQTNILYCSYTANSTLGRAYYEGIVWHNLFLENFTMFPGSIPPFRKFMCAEFGDLTLDGQSQNDIIVAIDSDDSLGDSLEICLGPESFLTMVDSFNFGCSKIVLGDLDNDGSDEVAFHTINTPVDPSTNVSICRATSSISWSVTLIENATLPVVTSMCAGDTDADDEIEFIYGTNSPGWLRLWDHPPGALWSGQSFQWTIQVTHPHPWIYEGESYPVEILVQNYGTPDMEGVGVFVVPMASMTTIGADWHYTPKISVGTNETFAFSLLPLTSGNHTVIIVITSVNPAVSYRVELNVYVRPRIPFQVQIGHILLELVSKTGNQTLLQSAVHVGNWLRSVGIPVNGFRAWNGDANRTDGLYPGYILATTQVGTFFLDLFRLTGDWTFMTSALQAANFLGNPSQGNYTMNPSGGFTWSYHDNAVFEATQVGIFLNLVDIITISDFFSTIVQGVSTYLISQADIDIGLDTMNWFNSSGLTFAASQFFVELGDITSLSYAESIGNWFISQVGVPTWVNSLGTSVRDENPLLYYQELGRAGITSVLSYLSIEANISCNTEITDLANYIVSVAYQLAEGTNWQESVWTTNITKLISSMNWDWGAAGIAASLADAFKLTGNQTYLDYAVEAIDWMANCVSFVGQQMEFRNVTSAAIRDSIASMLSIHDVFPVISVGYYVDPMKSLEFEGTCNLTGYVQTLGWHAYNVNLTIILPATMDLVVGQSETISIGTITAPDVRVVDWLVNLYDLGIYEIGIIGESDNAGSQVTNVTIEVTDLGVTKLQDASLHRIASTKGIEDQIYNVGEAVLLPIRVEYYDGSPAYNASVQVGDLGIAVVNGSGYAYIYVTQFDAGTVDVPISVIYDKQSGITGGTSTISVSLTFTGLEVFDVSVASMQAVVGWPILIEGYVRYAHNQAPAVNALVTFDGLVNASTDAQGRFQIIYTELTPQVQNYTITALMDGTETIFVCTQSQVVQLEWLPGVPLIIIGFGIGISIIVVAVGVIIFYKRRRRDTSISTNN